MTMQEYCEEQKKGCERIADELREHFEDGTLWDYFEDVLDYDFMITSTREYLGVRLWVTLGGPNICVDTIAGEVRSHFMGGDACAPISYNVADAIDDEVGRVLFES